MSKTTPKGAVLAFQKKQMERSNSEPAIFSPWLPRAKALAPPATQRARSEAVATLLRTQRVVQKIPRLSMTMCALHNDPVYQAHGWHHEVAAIVEDDDDDIPSPPPSPPRSPQPTCNLPALLLRHHQSSSPSSTTSTPPQTMKKSVETPPSSKDSPYRRSSSQSSSKSLALQLAMVVFFGCAAVVPTELAVRRSAEIKSSLRVPRFERFQY